jgi:rhamnose utilization protein RhaD (predicted bifunctional aldolase and dehydrogenase)/NAD(P)-dependent dehydrogenase (short-subunit alcohol dehydrogenase family)
MQSRYDTSAAAQAVKTFGAQADADLALRVYTSRLLGGDPALVLHGGGNTSVKTTRHELTGEPVEVLCVKGSGWDLGRIEPAGFPACRLEPLRRLCRLDALSDEDMVAALRSQMLDPSSPTPSVEALLHTFLPGKFVDHTHADAVLALQDQPNARAIASEVWGGAYLFVPYVMPGFALAKRVVELGRDLSGIHGLILEQHGIFTWGGTAEESYTRMIAGVTAAEVWRDSHRSRGAAAPLSSSAKVEPDARNRRQARLAPVLRGALERAGQGRFVMTWRDDDAILALVARDDARELTERGTVTPDHVIRTKPRPMWIESGENDGELRKACDRAVSGYAEWYGDYFTRGSAAHEGPLTRLDAAPRVVLVRGLGALTLGRTLADARVAGDIVARSAQVMQDAEAIGRFTPVAEQHLFDVEYWSLEQAKLARSGSSGPLAGRVAFVTGAAGGIGLAVAEHLLGSGAHVFMTDRAGDALDRAVASLAQRFGARVAGCGCDVTSSTEVHDAVERAVLTFGGLDLLVSNAGTAPQGLLHTADGDAALAASLEINLLGHQRVARAVTEVLLAQGSGGCLLFNASKSAVNPGPEFGPYAVPKAGLLALMRQYAVDLGSQGIRANAVNADRIRTDLFGGGVLEARAKARGLSPDAYFRQNLLGRETTAVDVAAAFAWLAQSEATTGCVVTVDGGNAAAFLR